MNFPEKIRSIKRFRKSKGQEYSGNLKGICEYTFDVLLDNFSVYTSSGYDGNEFYAGLEHGFLSVLSRATGIFLYDLSNPGEETLVKLRNMRAAIEYML